MERIREGIVDGKGQNTMAGGCYAVCLLDRSVYPKGGGLSPCLRSPLPSLSLLSTSGQAAGGRILITRANIRSMKIGKDRKVEEKRGKGNGRRREHYMRSVEAQPSQIYIEKRANMTRINGN